MKKVIVATLSKILNKGGIKYPKSDGMLYFHLKIVHKMVGIVAMIKLMNFNFLEIGKNRINDAKNKASCLIWEAKAITRERS